MTSARITTPCFRLVAAIAASVVAASCAQSQSGPDDPACHPPQPTGPVSNVATLAPHGEPGERMVLRTRIEDASGKPLSGVLVYAYHTNATGTYPKDAQQTGCFAWHGYLHAWTRTDASGEVEFRSIRPGTYPNRLEPAHVHLVLQFPGEKGFYVNAVVFSDDQLVTADYRRRERDPGGSGIVTPTRESGVWNVRHTLRLNRQ